MLGAGHAVREASRKFVTAFPGNQVERVNLPDLKGEVDWDPILTGVDAVVHLAAIAHRSNVGSDDYDKVNCVATANLARACLRHSIKRLIFISSIGAQAGSTADHTVTEADEPHPITAYDRAKLAAEVEVRKSGVPCTILRPVLVYGPGAKANIALMMRIAKLPVPLPFGSFRNRRSLVSIDNLSEAIVFCLGSLNTINKTFIVSDREPITLAEMFAILRESDGRSPGLIPLPPFAMRALLLSAGYRSLWDRIGCELVASSASLQEAGWLPKVDTRSGLRAMVEASNRLEGGKNKLFKVSGGQ